MLVNIQAIVPLSSSTTGGFLPYQDNPVAELLIIVLRDETPGVTVG
ncbi:hypothetical protein ACR9E3_02275 [Actinomycetospora sp. C-140]